MIHPLPTTIHIEKKTYHAPRPQMTGAELKQLGGVDPSFRLFLETPGKDPDVPIGDGEIVTLKDGQHFYSLPVGKVGGDTTTIHIEKKTYHAPRPQMTGAELKQLGGVDPSFRLFLETPGKDPDVPIGDGEIVTLKDGQHFYSLPVGKVGDDVLPSVRAEVEEIASTYPDARIHRHPSTPEMWIEVPAAGLPANKGWNVTATSILVPVPASYPSAKPPNFFVAAGLTRTTGGTGGMGSPQTVGTVPGSWCPMCWGPVAEGRTTLLSCVRFALSRFQEAQ